MNTLIPLVLAILLTGLTLVRAFWPRCAKTDEFTSEYDRTAASILLHAARRERQMAALERRMDQQMDERLQAIDRDGLGSE